MADLDSFGEPLDEVDVARGEWLHDGARREAMASLSMDAIDDPENALPTDLTEREQHIFNVALWAGTHGAVAFLSDHGYISPPED